MQVQFGRQFRTPKLPEHPSPWTPTVLSYDCLVPHSCQISYSRIRHSILACKPNDSQGADAKNNRGRIWPSEDRERSDRANPVNLGGARDRGFLFFVFIKSFPQVPPWLALQMPHFSRCSALPCSRRPIRSAPLVHWPDSHSEPSTRLLWLAIHAR